jgi:hypothetical protein
MNDSSSLANALSEPLRQPFWWAALASVGLHGVLGVNAPKISNLIYGGNSSKNLPGSVGFVELTPAEVGRLPQTIPPVRSNVKTPLSIAPVPLTLPRNITPPLPPAPSEINLPALPPGMPPPGFFSPLPPSPLPSLTAPPPPTAPPSPTLKAPSLKIPTTIPLQPSKNQLFPPLPGNFDPITPPPPPSLTGAPQPPGNQVDEGESLEKLRNSQGRLPLFPDGAVVYTPQFPIREAIPEPGNSPNLTQPDPNKSNQITETPEEIARREQFDRERKKVEQPGNPGSNSSSNLDRSIDAVSTHIALSETFRKAYPDLETIGKTLVPVAYPKAACSQKLEGTAVFSAVFNPQGLLKAAPQAIALTGSGILDDAAKIAIIDPNFILPPASKYRSYQLTVPFKYDEKVCSGIPVTPSTAPTPSPTIQQSPSRSPIEVKPQFEKQPPDSNKPKPGVKQSPAPQPQPGAKQSPSPQPKPGAKQSPSPQPQPGARDLMLEPQPAAEESPTLQPQPAVEESPTPQPAVSPTTESSPSPSPTASPVAAPSPSPVSAPTTEPSPTTSPSPAVSP